MAGTVAPPALRQPGGARRTGMASRRRTALMPYLFLAPALAILLLVSVYPLGFAIRRSFYVTHFMQLGAYVGLRNYTDFFALQHGWASVGHSVVFAAGSLICTLPLSLVLALALNHPMPFRTTIRTVLILPWIVSQAIAGLLWGWLLNPDFGPVSYVVGNLFHIRLAAFDQPATAMVATVLANTWQSYGLPFVLLLAALQTIPEELYEAAALDGAGRWGRLRWITLPMLRPTLAIALIMLTLHNLNMVTMILVLTGGGPAGATETLSVRIFNEAFQFQNLGLASMMGVIIAILNLAFSVAYLRVLRDDGAAA
ncbi:MAG: carbohydrate ABC transporter permease [Acetobacteraceae bacterium]